MNASRTLRGLAAGLLGTALAMSATAQETVRVGLLFSYSGISGMTGQAADNLLKQFQKTHGTEPGGKKLEFVRRDTTGPNREVARRMAQELITREKVQLIVGPDFTPNVLAIAPLVTEAKVPAIIMGAATQGVVGEKSPYYTRTFFSIPQVVRPAAQWAAKNGMKKMVVVVADYAPGHDAEATFTKARCGRSSARHAGGGRARASSADQGSGTSHTSARGGAAGVGHGDRLRQALSNLIGNAVKYTPAGGTIWVKATQEGGDVVARVQDTGIGIAPEVLPRIFELFTQEVRAKDLVPGGLGIGLAIVRQIAELHGGVVQARSGGTGKGSEFTLRIPQGGPPLPGLDSGEAAVTSS